MKNLLVDALRQAGDESDSPPEDQVVESARPDVPEAETTREANDKDLMLVESTVLPPSMAVPSQSGSAPDGADNTSDHLADQGADQSVHDIDDPVAVDADPVEEAAGASRGAADDVAVQDDDVVVDPTMVVPALSLKDAEAGQRSVAPPRAAVAAERQNRRRQPWITLGRWSPALCLIAMSATAGSVALYNRLAAQTMNVDLGTLPQQSVGDMPQQATAGWRALPATDDYLSADESTDGPGLVPDKPADGPLETNSTSSAGVRGAAGTAHATFAPESIADPAYDDVSAAFEAYEAGRFDIAEQRYRDALVTDSQHRHALEGLAAVLQRTGRTDAALPLYDQLLVLDPGDTSAAASLLAHTRQGDEATNEVRIKVLIQRHPESAALHFAMGVLLAEQQRWAEAHESFLAASSRNPGDAEYSFNVAVSAERLGRAATARSYYRLVQATARPDALIDLELVGERLQALGTAQDDAS